VAVGSVANAGAEQRLTPMPTAGSLPSVDTGRFHLEVDG